MKILRNFIVPVLLLGSQILGAQMPGAPEVKPRNFGWLIEGQLCGLARPTSRADLKYLEDNNVGLVVTLTQEKKPAFYDALYVGRTLERLYLPVRDYSIPTFEQVDQFIAAANETIDGKKAVAVHCEGGIGRTGVMLACYLAIKENKDALTAIKEVRAKRPRSVETPDQAKFVADYLAYKALQKPATTEVKDVDPEAPAAENLELFVRKLDGKRITLTLPADATMATAKEKIFDLENIPVDQQVLDFHGKPLDDDATVRTTVEKLQAGGGIVHLIIKKATESKASAGPAAPVAPEESTTVFVRKLDRRVIILENLPSRNTVATIKDRIFELENIPVDKQRLIFRGKDLDDNMKIGDASKNIIKEGEVHLVIK